MCLLYAVCIPSVIQFLTAGVGGSTKKFVMTCAYQLGFAVGNIVRFLWTLVQVDSADNRKLHRSGRRPIVRSTPRPTT